MAAIRSLSLTLNSSAPVTSVSPRAHAAAIRSAGISSMAKGTSSRGTSIPRSSRRSISRSASGSAPETRSFITRISAPMSRSAFSRPVREGLMPTLRSVSTPSAARQPATIKNAADEKSPGTSILHPCRRAGPRMSMLSAPHLHIYAERLQHALAVITGYRGFDDRSGSFRVDAREEDARTLPARSPSAAGTESPCRCRPPAMRTGGRPDCVSIPAPICRSGIATRSIGRRMSEASPISSESKRLAGQQSREQAHRGARIAHIERRARCGQDRAFRHRSTTTPCPAARSIGTPSARMAASVARQSSLSRKPLTTVRPSAMPASIRDRCEIDLSPGTVSVPRT